MGVAAQIAEHIFWASERTLRVDHPVLSEQWSQPRRKGSRLSEELQVSMKVELAIMKGALERFVELSAKDVTEHLDGKKEIVAWFDPARVIGRQSTGWHHAMNMWVGREFLTPGMQNTEEANFCTEGSGIAGHFEESFCTGAKQEIVEDLLVLQDQRCQMPRKRQDHLTVSLRATLPATHCAPPLP